MIIINAILWRKAMRKRLLLLAVVAFFSYNFFVPQSPSLLQDVPLKVIQSGSDFLVVSWKVQDLTLTHKQTDGLKASQVTFEGAVVPPATSGYMVPITSFRLGIPQNSRISCELSDIVYETKVNINLAPVSRIGRDKNGITISDQGITETLEDSMDRSIIQINNQEFFRDLPVVRIDFRPVQYDPVSKELKIIRSATLNFKISDVKGKATAYIAGRSKLDRLYDHMVINFDQAKQWIVRQPPTLKKVTTSFSGPWYRIEAVNDGLYKITASTLSSAGINIQDVDPRTIKIYNHGGKTLHPNTTTYVENPVGPIETAIYIAGEEDGSFDSQDYILFYGTGAGGWYYSESENDFEFFQHPYDVKNYYLLTYGSGTGKRMQSEETPTGGAAVTESYFMERVHYEEDKYNLLASGTDWYGYRFFGQSNDVSINYNIDNLSTTANQAEMRIKFKGGSGLRYLDDDPYRYYFSVWINSDKAPSAIISEYLLREERWAILEREFLSTDYLKEGSNSVYIKYTGNFESCNAYLDWIEFFYPRNFVVENNQLLFYTNSTGQIVHYDIGGFSQEDIKIFDISNPVEVKILNSSTGVQNGTLGFNLDLRDNKSRRLLVSSLNSGDIINVTSISSKQPKINLLDPSLAADLIIITHPSFEPYANEIKNLRENGFDPIDAIVVNTDDIYFYFSSSVKDVMAIRNFLRYAYYNWSSPRPSYVLLFGDGHYDYRNIALEDTNRVPPFEITANLELYSRESDNLYVDVNFASSTYGAIQPDMAVGRLPVESEIDCKRIIEKLKDYDKNTYKDGWQTTMTFVGDDEVTSLRDNEWEHQRQAETLAELSQIKKFIKKKIYLSAFESVPGGFSRVKPKANQAIIDQLNEGTLLINYVGHGSPTAWAHESALDMTRDLNRIQNEGKLPLWIAATCDFGKYDDPHDPSFSEALIWQERKGAIAVISSARLVYSSSNFRFNRDYIRALFPSGQASRRLGDALLLSTGSGENDQKYHLFGDPSMYLADPRNHISVDPLSPDTLKALSKVSISGSISPDAGGEKLSNFEGGAFLIVNDASYDSVNTGGPDSYTLFGPRIFKGEISVDAGAFIGEFIVPKSIRYSNQPRGRVTIFAWDENSDQQAIGYVDTLLFMGTNQDLSDDEGPEISLYFGDRENFRDGDLVTKNPVLTAEIFDENGINLTQEVGHRIEIQIDDEISKDITSFFAYNRNSYSEGELSYHLDNLESGEHSLKLEAWDNLNNPSSEEINFRVADTEGLLLSDVVNFPNPFGAETNFTFQLLGSDAATEIEIKIYTITGRLIKTFDNLIPPSDGFNYDYPWDGRDDDGDIIANGVYLYKLIVRNENEQKEVIEKVVVLR
jgi:hypothetical protein